MRSSRLLILRTLSAVAVAATDMAGDAGADAVCAPVARARSDDSGRAAPPRRPRLLVAHRADRELFAVVDSRRPRVFSEPAGQPLHRDITLRNRAHRHATTTLPIEAPARRARGFSAPPFHFLVPIWSLSYLTAAIGGARR